MKIITKPKTYSQKNYFFALLILMITCMTGFSQAVVPTLTGPLVDGLPATLGGGITTGQVYTTEPGMTNYVWTVSSAGIITAASAAIITDPPTNPTPEEIALSHSITVTWANPTSQQFVSVSYTPVGGVPSEITTLIINYFPFLPAIDPTIIPKFVDPLPHFAAGLRVNAKAGGNLQIKAVPVRQKALSTGTVLATGTINTDPLSEIGKGNYAAYAISTNNGASFGPAMWPAQTIETQQGNPVTVKYINDLVGVRYSDFNILADQTLMMNGYTLNGNPLVDPYNGPIPMVVHLHGGEMPSGSDGGPNSWFMPTRTVGVNTFGPGFPYNNSDLSTYPNQQEATTLWYHPHDDGLTRINVYTGLAGYYFIRGEDEEVAQLAGWSGDDRVQEVQPPSPALPPFNGTNAYLPEIELGIQDRMFNVNGELFWPVEPTNPDIHPFWTPEFVGDVMVVNGKSWPYLSVAPRRYRFRILEGCNARFLNMWLVDAANGTSYGPKITVIGGEGGLLETPVNLDPAAGKTLLMAPGQRYDVIIDFTGLAGKTFTLMNNARSPYPLGDPVIPGLTDRIMQFVVNGNMVAANSLSPGSDKSARVSPSFNLRPVTPLVKLTDFNGGLTQTDAPAVKRQLILNEVNADGGPAAVLINNAYFEAALALPGTPEVFGGPTETPVEGTTEIYKIINVSADAHPIHIHLTQWQIVSRQKILPAAYMTAYEAAWATREPPVTEFPTGMGYPGGAGSPFPYDTPINGYVGGNPDVTPFLSGAVIPANPEEQGWKDNVIVMPGEVTTLLARFAPTDKPVNATPAELKFPFDPSEGPGYVWHCHIVDHEDMSMMRPLHITPSLLRVPHFTKVWSGNGQDHMNFYARTAKHNAVNLQPGDEIGIFDGDLCVGVGVLTQVLNGTNFLEIKVSRASSTSSLDGYTTGHQATFKLWDAAKQKEITTVDVAYISGDNIFNAGASTSFRIGGYSDINQQISLLDGWNIFSLFVTPANTAMDQVVQPLITAGSLVKVQDETGAALEFNPITSGWDNQIGPWRYTEGYKIRVNRTTSLSVTGLPIFQPVSIDLLAGWNIISYPELTSQDAMQVLSDLINAGNLVKVQDETGSAMEYIPGSTEWVNNIGSFDPGEGYKVRVSVNTSLAIHPSISISSPALPAPILALKSATIPAVPEYFKPVWKGNGLDHMNIYLSEDGLSSVLKAGNEIGIYDGSLCVGAGVIQNTGKKFFSFVVSADDPTTSEIDGFISGHTPSFRVWDQASNLEKTIETFEYAPGSSRVFEPMATTAIKIKTMPLGLTDPLEGTTSLGDNYPNPFNGETTIPFIVGKDMSVDISIFDILGKKLNTLVHGNLQSGSYTTVWKANDDHSARVNPGIYICKMLAGEKAFVKLVVVK